MKTLKKLFKLVLTNLVVLMVILVVLNIVSIFVYNSYIDYQENKEYISNKAKLPNYNNVEWANLHFKEMNDLNLEFESYIGWRAEQYSGETINIDEDGIRNTLQHKNVNEESQVVVFLGGSTMWGEGATDSTTIPSYYSLKGNGRYKVKNFGERAYRAFQSYLFLKLEINQNFKPDIVISYDGVNEIFGNYSFHKPVSHYHEKIMADKLRNKGLEKLSYVDFLLGPLNKVLSKAKSKWMPSDEKNKEDEYVYDISEERTKKVAQVLLDSWLDTKALAEENGALFFCVLQPTTGIGSPNLEHLNLDEDQQEVFNQLYPMVITLLETPKYKTLTTNFIDLSHVLDGEERYYIDFCHLSPNGNEVVANNLFVEIENRIKNITKQE